MGTAAVINGDGGSVVYATVCLRSGIVLDRLGAPGTGTEVAGWASAAPELFRSDRKAKWAALFARLGGDGGGERFREFILISPEHVHVIEQLSGAPDVALVAVSSARGNLGVLLSAARHRLTELERG